MHDIIQNNPFIRLVFPFIVGIWAGIMFVSCDIQLCYIFLTACLVSWLTLFFIKDFHGKAPVQNALLILIFLVMGLTQAVKETHEPKIFEEKAVLVTQIMDFPDSTASSIKLKTDILFEIKDSTQQPIQGKAYVYIPNNTRSRKLQAGDMLLMHAKPEIIKNQNNPGAFNFKEYAATQGFYYQLFLPDKNWQLSSVNQSFNLNIELKKFRRKIFNYYRQSGLNENELAVFSALTLGDKSLLEHDLRQGYVSAGLMHVLAVSGLHVGIIYMVVKFLLKGLMKKRWGTIVRFFVSIAILWGYAMFTGLSPSVTRAATMFSVFVIGDLFGKRYAVYNSMALAAFILLFYNPLLLLNVGFQMSFLAVMGIVFFYPIVYKWIYVPHKYLDKIWQLMAVSIAAQIITTPLSLYYFHQFPLLFMLSNLLMVPLATVLMYVFVMMIVFMPVPFISQKIGWLADKLTWLMNQFTQWIHQLEWATIKFVHINELQMLILYAVIVIVTYWGIRTNYRRLKLVFYFLIAFSLTVSYQYYNRTVENRLIVFNTFREPLILYASGRDGTIINPQKLENCSWFIQPVMLENGLKQQIADSTNMLSGEDLHIFGDYPYNGIFYNVDHFPVDDTIHCRWLVLSEKSPFDIQKLLTKIKPEMIIADPAVSGFKLNNWQKTLSGLQMRFYTVSQQGAFVETW